MSFTDAAAVQASKHVSGRSKKRAKPTSDNEDQPIAKKKRVVDALPAPNHAVVHKETGQIVNESRHVDFLRDEAAYVKRIMDQQTNLARSAISKNGEWDVAGVWSIDCPYIQQKWGGLRVYGGQYSCEIRIGVISAKKGRQMWASFDFIKLEGVLRFRSHDDETAIGKAEPSTKEATRRAFSWRGRENDGPVHTSFDQQHGFLVFAGAGGTELSGQIAGSQGIFEFTGRKISKSKVNAEELMQQWETFGGNKASAPKSAPLIQEENPPPTRTIEISSPAPQKPRSKQTARKSTGGQRPKTILDQQAKMIELVRANGGTWDLTGKWAINCPYVQNEWGEGGRYECEMIIGVSPGKNGTMWASFNFIVFYGVMRFAADGKEVVVGEARSEDDEMDEDESSEGSSDETQQRKTVQVPKQKPTNLAQHTVQTMCRGFFWRGQEMEGPISIDFDGQRGCITFDGPGGTELSGRIAGFHGVHKFTGRKVSQARVDTNSLKGEWDGLDEEEYERQSKSRWH